MIFGKRCLCYKQLFVHQKPMYLMYSSRRKINCSHEASHSTAIRSKCAYALCYSNLVLWEPSLKEIQSLSGLNDHLIAWCSGLMTALCGRTLFTPPWHPTTQKEPGINVHYINIYKYYQLLTRSRWTRMGGRSAGTAPPRCDRAAPVGSQPPSANIHRSTPPAAQLRSR